MKKKKGEKKSRSCYLIFLPPTPDAVHISWNPLLSLSPSHCVSDLKCCRHRCAQARTERTSDCKHQISHSMLSFPEWRPRRSPAPLSFSAFVPPPRLLIRLPIKRLLNEWLFTDHSIMANPLYLPRHKTILWYFSIWHSSSLISWESRRLYGAFQGCTKFRTELRITL